MIIGDGRSYGPRPDGRTTLDELFRRAVAQRPDAIALMIELAIDGLFRPTGRTLPTASRAT